MCKRGEIYYVDFDNEMNTRKQSGRRPVVVVSNNKANTYSPVVTIVPLTSNINKKKALPTHVHIPLDAGYGLNRESMVLAEQVETIDKDKLLSKKGMITNNDIMEKITIALQIQIGVYEEYN
ncbi:type II toxin-antitoxin system PemK/MazF family toxin [Clostridium polynesiense]|uniref:type II toxin-antitoxin system PemK/MazF family toxin n=1 Tax=Clostridium polynesiense TaxID=1325933 RepID=UPI00058C9666|nr:type II toxin-antitoxin system PemK/MazF family toxin [Clostridium polynesiense]